MTHFRQGEHGNRLARLTFCLCCVFCVFFLTGAKPLSSLEIRFGRAFLVLHEKTGRFSLYGLNEGQERYESFLSDKDPKTSFIEISVNGRTHRLGESSTFKLSADSAARSPAFVFESKTLRVRQEFTFIQTSGSTDANGVQMTIRVTNLQSRDVTIGARVLLNTRPHGEAVPFFFNDQGVGVETVIAGGIDSNWTTRDGQFSVMGSIKAVSGENPDYLHFADWKLLSKLGWASSGGRERNKRVTAIVNPAVCYYYNPKPLPANGEINYTVLLAAGDPAGFTSVRVPEIDIEGDLKLLAASLRLLEQHINGEIEISNAELAGIQETINRIKKRYNLP